MGGQFIQNQGTSISGFKEDYQVFLGQSLTGGAAATELALRYRDGVRKLIVSEVYVYVNGYTPATGSASGQQIELHWAADASSVDSTGVSDTRLSEFVYENQNVCLMSIRESTAKLFIKASITGTFQIVVRYYYSL